MYILLGLQCNPHAIPHADIECAWRSYWPCMTLHDATARSQTPLPQSSVLIPLQWECYFLSVLIQPPIRKLYILVACLAVVSLSPRWKHLPPHGGEYRRIVTSLKKQKKFKQLKFVIAGFSTTCDLIKAATNKHVGTIKKQTKQSSLVTVSVLMRSSVLTHTTKTHFKSH